MSSIRLPHFKRSPEIPKFRLTDRDRAILHQVHKHRFLRSDHITSLIPGSRQQTLRRLQLLYHHGYLERPRCQIDYYHRGGSRAIAYGLGNKGAGLLKRELSLPYHRLDWPKKNAVTRLFLEHALLVSDVMVAVELACREQPDIRLLSPDDIDPPSPRAKNRHPFQWKVSIGRGQTCTVIPDRVFGLEFTNRPKPQNRIWYCLEADRGTMPVTRANFTRSSYTRKLHAYAATWQQNLHRTQLGWHRFRVMTVTTNSARLASMRTACDSLPRGQGLFLFADTQMLRATEHPLALPWQTYRDDETVLLNA